jgi:U32 family peptidase
MKKPELILPAGSPDKLRIAYQYGGDACYVGLPPFSLRARENKFDEESFRKAFELARELGKKIYVTTNIYPHNAKIDAFEKHIKLLAELKPDAIICANAGVFGLIKEHYPDAKIHISVQANSVNYRDVMFWRDLGASRVILPRELLLNEIKEIHERVPEMELECFVHGAICVSYSGRCLVSNYLTMRDPNQGSCAQSCRWKYKVLEEAERPGEYMPIDEDEHGTYLFNAKDLCALPSLKELAESGVTGFKVEGRSKTVYYLSTVAKVYRKAIDDMVAGREFDQDLMETIMKTSNRSFTPGFLKKKFDESAIFYKHNAPTSQYQFVGVVRGKKDNSYEIELKNRITKGNEIEVMTPDQEFPQKLEEIFDEEGESLEEAHGGHKNVFVKFKKELPIGAILRQKVK